LRWLTDENLDQRIVQWLIDSGQDVIRVVDLSAGAQDPQILTLSMSERRFLMTDDKDFGELLIRRQIVAPGAVLIRMHGVPMDVRIARLAEWWVEIESQVSGALIVVTMSQLRSRRLP